MLQPASDSKRFELIKSFKDKPACPVNSHHSVTTNLFGEWVCESCANHVDELLKKIERENQ